MSKFRKSKLASAMLCTLLFGGNAAGAVKKDMSKVISKNDLSTKDKELENRKLDDSGNKFLKYALYVLGLAKLADEGVGIAEANEYIKNEKLYPLGKLSIYKNLVARSYRAKTIGTMRKLVDGSNKHKQDIQNFFDKVTKKVYDIKDNGNGCAKVEGKGNLFDISLAAAGKNYLDIKYICRDAGLLTENNDPAIPEYVEEYVKAVLRVSVEDCDRILVNVCGSEQYRYIAFVKGNACLKLSHFNNGLDFCLTEVNAKLNFDHDDFKLSLEKGDYGYSITLPYMEHILGVKHD